MVFTSFEFMCLFLPVLFFLSELAFFKTIHRSVLLLTLASVVFLANWNITSVGIFFAVMILSSLFIYKQYFVTKKQLFCVLSIILLPLIYYKYSFFLLSIVGIKGTPQELPLAISFYTFVIVAYFVDLHRKHVVIDSASKKKELRDFFFFTSFFPHLIAGPIVHRNDLVPQIYEDKNRAKLFKEGIFYFAIGFCKKFFLADPLGSIANTFFETALKVELSFFESIVAIFSYTLQIYYDFSGYSDMAIGIGLIFGYRLPWNFNSPYKSLSITDFWRRWHMTLSRFLRDYIYIPLGGSRKGIIRNYINIFLVMLISGFWHGAGWTFILWGICHGAFLCAEKYLSQYVVKFKINSKPLAVLYTFIMVSLLWVLFRAVSLDHAMNVYAGLSTFNYTIDISWKNMLYIVIAFCILVLPNSQEIVQKIMLKTRENSEYIYNFAKTSYFGIVLGIILCVASLNLFYKYTVDYTLYKKLNIERYIYGVDNLISDYRSNIFSSPIFSKKKKCIFVGSSFTMTLGFITFTKDDEEVYSTTIGTGGNSIIVGLRQAFSVLDISGVETIVLGVSPLNLGNITHSLPFQGQLLENVNTLIPLNLEQRAYASAHSLDLSLYDYMRLLILEEARFQFSEFIFKLGTAFHLTSFERRAWKKDITFTEEKIFTPAQALDNFQNWQKSATLNVLPKNITNGQDSTFNWQKRGIFESLLPDGDVYKALKALKIECDKRGIKFVVYSTPTPSHKQAPHIYPEGFYETYQQTMLTVTDALRIEYFDLSHVIAWDKGAMNDFIHPVRKAGYEIHKLLLSYIYGEKK